MTSQVHDFPPQGDLVADMARRIRARLGELNMSKSELARRWGVTQQKASRIALGQTAVRIEELSDLASILGVEVGYFFGYAGSPRDPGHPSGPDGSTGRVMDPTDGYGHIVLSLAA